MNLIEYVESLGVKLRRSGHGLRGLCPLHEEHTPSFFVTPEKKLWHCFGCGCGGDIYNLIMLIDKCTFSEAVVIAGEPPTQRPMVQVAKQEVLTSEIISRMTIACEKYMINLERNYEAWSYIERREISDLSIVRYKLGWCRSEEDDLEEPLGKEGVPKLRERIVVPCTWKNSVIYMQGRTMSSEIKPKYLGLHLPKPLFGFDKIEHKQTVYLTEGVFDWLTLLQWGIPAVCPLGANLSTMQTALLLNKEVVCCQDADTAGDNAAKKVAEDLPRTRRLRPPEPYKDWNEWLIAGATRADFDYINLIGDESG
jgi:DNA primase